MAQTMAGHRAVCLGLVLVIILVSACSGALDGAAPPATVSATAAELPGKLGETVAATATPATSRSPLREPAGDAGGWLTYEDAEQRYRLRYPAGATIATDQSGHTTFTLTDNQTTYTTTARGWEAPAGLDRPALILETIHQNMGAFDISEPQELTINGVQAALIAYSCCWTDVQPEPCGTRRDQAAAFLLGEQLYTLTFEVAGPDQCDATTVPLFEQMLHSFEPYQSSTPAAALVNPIATGSSIEVSGWSPDGQWLAFWRAEDDAAAQPYPAETLHFYNAGSGETCNCPEFHTEPMSRRPLPLAWQDDGQVVVWDGAQARRGTPCQGNFQPTDAQAPTYEVQTEALSPGGSYRAATHAEGAGDGRIHATTTFTDARSGRLVQTIGYTHRGGEVILGLGGEWVTDGLFLIRETEERGPLLVDLEQGQVIAVMVERFGLQQVPSPELGFWAAAKTMAGSDTYHIVLGGVELGGAAPRLQLYHSETGQVEELEFRYAFPPTFSPDGRWLLMGGFSGPVGSTPTLWVRPVDPAGSPARLVAEGDYAASWSPDWTRVAMAGSASASGLPRVPVVTVYSFPEGMVLNSWATGEYWAQPVAWSPDGRRLAMSGNLPGEWNYGLFIVEP